MHNHHPHHHTPSNATRIPKSYQPAATHGKHHGHSAAEFASRFWLSLLLSIPVILYSPMVKEWLTVSPPAFPGADWIPAILGSIVFLYGGTVFIKSAYHELAARKPGMMTLISLAILAAYTYSMLTTFVIGGTEFFWELATLIVVMLLGHWLEMRSVANAQGALRELAKLLPDTAELANGTLVPVSELRVGDVVTVRPGAKIPADGTVVQGHSEVNEAMITGESRPFTKAVHAHVIAGTVNGSGSLTVAVTRVGESTALAGIMRLVAEAQNSQSKAQALADTAAFYLTVVAVIAGTVTMFGWLIAGQGMGFALERTVTVLVIACPHALGLAIPLVTSISTTLGAKNGLLVKKQAALESARNINTVLFDKTGTLTRGEQSVVDIWPVSGQNTEYVLKRAAAAEQASEHAIGKAIVTKAKEKGLVFTQPKSFRAIAGHGVEIELDSGHTVAVGGPRLLELKQAGIPVELQKRITQAHASGKSAIFVLEDNTVLGAIAITDTVREESVQAVGMLKEAGMAVAMVTGDSHNVAAYVAKQLGLDTYFAQVLPEHKADKVKELQGSGRKVAMVGDGINDAPALAQADLGIAIGAGTDVAIESADIVLIKNNPLDIPKIITLSKASYSKMLQNLFWATGYNVVAIPLAAGILAGSGIILPPALGAGLMSISTIVVALNAQLLRRLKL